MKKNQNTKADTLLAHDNLVALENEFRPARAAKDINNKIDTLEDSLHELQTELNEVNKSVAAGLNRLDDSDLDLNSKVTETYKRLGEIDQTYQTLSEISDNIDSEVKKLTREIADVAEKSATELETIEASSTSQYSQLKEQHEQLVHRVNKLVRNAQQTHAQLTESINNNTSAMLKLKEQVVDDINTLNDTTQQRDDELDAKLGKAQKAIDAHKASILKLQAVDKALDKRAAELEKTTSKLSKKSREHQSAIALLDERAKELAWTVETMQTQLEKQAGKIVDLQVDASLLKRALVALAGREKRHFLTLSGILALLIVAVALFAYHQYTLNNTDAEQIAGVQTDIEKINSKLQQVDDQYDSLDGRLNYTSPFSQFGTDSVIHGPQWLARQPADHVVITLATTSSKKEMYTIAQRNRHFFNRELAYYAVGTAQGFQYVLVYGNFADASQASSQLWRMPRYINHQRPVITRIGDIHKQI